MKGEGHDSMCPSPFTDKQDLIQKGIKEKKQ